MMAPRRPRSWTSASRFRLLEDAVHRIQARQAEAECALRVRGAYDGARVV